ncbi:hypothetical protein JYU34_007688 [Plutella xylostella]|uniref:Zinc finger CW-type PWWP domain protein 1 n=1 Tax=Plutella xylostella TaxID=51655 RepID=A0ABQ7QR28_PLUXY|nr:hypothetical protein JYU34_007688 [Plutella xylostella]
MEKANLPTEKAIEPKEDARQPMCNQTSETPAMPPDGEIKKRKKQKITFAESENTEKACSQSSTSTYKEALSQPAPGLSHRQKMLWLQKRRGVGLWVLCDDCERWRYLADVLDRHELPNRWYCRFNPDKTMADCSIPESPLRVRDEEDLIHSEYSAGSVVWARLPGWPWWPAMVDDCPDTEQFYWLDGFSDIPTYYNVVFFDAADATRAWITPENLKPFLENKKSFRKLQKGKNKQRLQAAVSQADDAATLSVPKRLEKYSFIARYNGTIGTPKKISKNVLQKYQKRLQKKYNIQFPIEGSSESEDDIPDSPPLRRKNNNVIIVGTPKSSKESKKVKTCETAPQKLSAIVENTIDNLQDSLLQSQIANGASQLSEIPSTNDETTENIFKEPNSMIAQVGTNNPSAKLLEIDNTLKLSVPETMTQSEPATNDTDPDFDIRIAPSPSSDDFEF